MEARPGIVGVVIVAPGRIVFQDAAEGQGIEDQFESAMLRFHYGDYEQILPSQNLKKIHDQPSLQKAMGALKKYFYGCYNSDRLVLLPPEGTLAVVFDGKVYGEKVLVHYHPDNCYISPSMSDLKVRKKLAELPDPSRLTRQQQWQHDLLYVSSFLPVRHPNLFYQLSQQAFASKIKRIGDDVPEMSDVEIFLSLSEIFAQIGDAHTTVSPPNELMSMYPIEFSWFSDGLFVVAAVKGYEQSLKARLVKIGNTDVETIYRAASAIIPHENDSRLREQSLRVMRMPRILEGLGVVSRAESQRLTFIAPPGDHLVLEVEAVPWNGWRGVQWVLAVDRNDPGLPVSRQKREGYFWYEYLEPSRTLYCQYNRCKETRERPMAAFTAELMAFLNSHEVDRFILDLRKNTGGHSPLLNPLISALSKSKVNRHGKLFCLIGRKTFSSAVLNAVALKRDTEAIVVGAPTSGKPYHFGQVESTRLPYSQLRIQYATKYCGHSPSDAPTLAPDVPAQVSSVEYFSGKDPVLDTALAYPAGTAGNVAVNQAHE
jgi:hypothetical protein